VRQACYLPVVEGGEGPLIGRLGEGEGEWLAAGHSCCECSALLEENTLLTSS
jgi:hypothetical protein